MFRYGVRWASSGSCATRCASAHGYRRASDSATGKNNSTEVKFAQFILSRTFGSGFSVGLMAKDLRTALELAQQVGAPMPLGSHCVPVWNDAEKALGANADHTEIVRVLERVTGTELKAG